MSVRRLPVRPDPKQLHRQPKEFLRDVRAANTEALAELAEFCPSLDPRDAKLADAQFVIARSYGAGNWPRLAHAVRLADAIWRDDIGIVRELIGVDPNLLGEPVLVRTDSNWGPPMTYAANLGRDEIIRFLFDRGARDLESAAGRAALQGKVGTVHLIHDLAGRPLFNNMSFAGPAYTLSVEGTAVLFALGANPIGPRGIDTNTIEHLLGTDSRNPAAKHQILEMYVEHGFDPPNTPVMALHRGRIDLLEQHFASDPDLPTRTFSIEEVYPLAPACSRQPYTAQGTPVHGTTLLHLAAYFDELDIARWLLDHGTDPNVLAAVDADGFGGYSALFSTVVSQHNFWVNYGKGRPDTAEFTRLLLDRGAHPNIRASIRHKREAGHGGGRLAEYRDVTALTWGERFEDQIFVSKESMRLVEEYGGR